MTTTNRNTSTVILAPSFEIAKDSSTPAITVEAEYGDEVWEGSIYTAAHHQAEGPFAGRHIVEGGRPSPCNDNAIPTIWCEATQSKRGNGTIGVSHIDLDTIGGVLRAWGVPLFTPLQQGFWDLAEFVDVNGAHMLTEANPSMRDEAKLWAWWAWKEEHVGRFDPDAFTDVTELVREACRVLTALLDPDVPAEDGMDLVDKGHDLKEAQEKLSLDTFVELRKAGCVVFTRCSHQFVNHLYTVELVAGETEIAQAIVAFSPRYGSITISLAAPIEGVNCRDIVQGLWGPEAGGHPGIAGSPRGARLMLADVEAAAEAISNAINES